MVGSFPACCAPAVSGHEAADPAINLMKSRRRVAARSREACDKTKPDRILADAEDDGDHRCCRFGRDRGHGARRGNHGHPAAN